MELILAFSKDLFFEIVMAQDEVDTAQVFFVLITLFFYGCNLIQIVLNVVLSDRCLIVGLVTSILKLSFAGLKHALSLSIFLFLKQRAFVCI